MKFLFLIGVASAALSTGAVAQERQARPDLTRAQAVAQAEKLFGVMDRNKDGQLTRDEVQLATEALRTERQKRMDERMAQATPEQRARMEERRAEWAKRRAEGAAGGSAEARRGGGGMMGLDRLLGDKQAVTRAEFLQQMTDRFDRSDANRDGVITADEQQQRRGDRRQRSEEVAADGDDE